MNSQSKSKRKVKKNSFFHLFKIKYLGDFRFFGHFQFEYVKISAQEKHPIMTLDAARIRFNFDREKKSLSVRRRKLKHNRLVRFTTRIYYREQAQLMIWTWQFRRQCTRHSCHHQIPTMNRSIHAQSNKNQGSKIFQKIKI